MTDISELGQNNHLRAENEARPETNLEGEATAELRMFGKQPVRGQRY